MLAAKAKGRSSHAREERSADNLMVDWDTGILYPSRHENVIRAFCSGGVPRGVGIARHGSGGGAGVSQPDWAGAALTPGLRWVEIAARGLRADPGLRQQPPLRAHRARRARRRRARAARPRVHARRAARL